MVRPRGARTGILLARADGDRQAAIVGQQFVGRVGLFLRVDDFESFYQHMITAGVRFVSPPRDEALPGRRVPGSRGKPLGPARPGLGVSVH